MVGGSFANGGGQWGQWARRSVVCLRVLAPPSVAVHRCAALLHEPYYAEHERATCTLRRTEVVWNALCVGLSFKPQQATHWSDAWLRHRLMPPALVFVVFASWMVWLLFAIVSACTEQVPLALPLALALALALATAAAAASSPAALEEAL